MIRVPLTLFLLMAMMASLSIAQVSNDTGSAASSLTVGTGSLQLEGRTDGERVQLLMDVATVYVNEGEYKAAVDVYERILKIAPDHKDAKFMLGHVYISAGMYAKAETNLKALIKEYPDEFQLKNNLAWLYSTAADPAYRDGEKAVKLAQEAMVLAPTDYHVWSTLSEAYYVSGQYEKAFRAIVHMASLASRFGTNITREMVDEYNEQIRKCRRALDSQRILNGEENNPADPAESGGEQQPGLPDQ